MKKRLFKLVSMILTIALLSQALCLQMFAAGKGYISELRLSWSSKSAEAAKQWLWDNGYDVIDCDLNGGTNGRPWVYLGYKTTDNPDEAITDVKIMNMNGGFITFDTQEELRSMYSTLFHDGEKLLMALGEFRQNYWDGSVYTKSAVEILNLFYLDNDVPLGDHLLGDVSLEDIIDLRYFSATMPSQMLVSMLSLGMRGANDIHPATKLAEKLAPSEVILDEENTEPPLETEDPLEAATSETTALEESADDISSETIAETIAEVTDSETEVTETTESLAYEEAATVEPVAEVIPQSGESATVMPVTAAAPPQMTEIVYTDRDHDLSYDVYDAIQRVQDLYRDYPSLGEHEVEFFADLFGGMSGITLTEGVTFLDHLLSIETPADALPLTASLTDGQVVMLGQQGVEFFITTNTSESDILTMLSDIKNIGERAYFWEGREQIDYDHGFAMTVDTLANLDLSEHGDTTSQLFAVLSVATGAIAVIALATTVYYVVQLVSLLKVSSWSFSIVAYTAEVAIHLLAHGPANCFVNVYGASAKAFAAYGSGALRLGLILSTAAFVVFALLTAYLVYRSIKDFYSPDFSAIPWTVADMFTSREGVSNLIYYKAVLDDENVAGDLNAWEGNSWNALYTTKDKRVGDPIKADMITLTGNSEAPQGYLPVTHFGKVVAQNTNIGTYSSVKHYIFFRNNEPSFPGSVFGGTSGHLIFGGTGIIVGAALGAVGMHFINKRKRQVI